MMRRVIDLEATDKKPNLLELFKGVDLRRTLIVCGVYAAQNLTGNLIANQAVYFFQRKSSWSLEEYRGMIMLTRRRGWHRIG